MLKTKCILAPIEEFDGIRISVMSKHTLNDGITPNPQINIDSYDFWLPSLAPPLKLIGKYYRKELAWEEYETKYLEYLRQAKVKTNVQNIARIGLKSDITLLCIEETPEHSHRRLLAEECIRYEPKLILKVA